jgi:hypothetical protein
VTSLETQYQLALGESELQLLIYAVQGFYKEKDLDHSPQSDKILSVFHKMKKLMVDKHLELPKVSLLELMNDEIPTRSIVYKS